MPVSVRALGQDLHHHPSARVGELAGVDEQVAHHLGHPRRVRPDPYGTLRRREGQAHLLGLEAVALVLHRAPHQLDQVHGLALELDLVAGDAGDVQQIVHQLGELAHLPPDHRLGAAALLAAGGPVVQHIHAVVDGRQRVAQFVGQDGQELVFAPVGRFQGRLAVAQFPLRLAPLGGFAQEPGVGLLQLRGALLHQLFQGLLLVPKLRFGLHPGHHVAEQAAQRKQDLQVLLGERLGSPVPDDGHGGDPAVAGERQEGQRTGRVGQGLGAQEAGLQHRPDLAPGQPEHFAGRNAAGERMDEPQLAVLARPHDQHHLALEEAFQRLGQFRPGILPERKVTQVLRGAQHDGQSLGGCRLVHGRIQ
jgi:hypothetical protein